MLTFFRDTLSSSARHRAEHLSREAAANAHASYYSHPSLHLHTYLPKRTASGTDILPDSEQDGAVVSAMNDPAPSAAVPDPDDKIGKVGTEGTRGEEGGKENAGKPTGKDLVALEPNGEAGGTYTSPGPTAAEVERFEQTQQDWFTHTQGVDGAQGAQGAGATNVEAGPGVGVQHDGQHPNGGLQVPGVDGGRPGMQRFWSVRQRMEPHLQIM